MKKSTLFHSGELYFQQNSGVEEKAALLAERLIHKNMTGQHQDFFSQLNMLFVASVDETGQPWASVISERPGFIQVVNENTIHIHSKPLNGDPLIHNLLPNNHLGFLGLEMHTRRRNRLSGKLTANNDNDIVINIDKAFGNCPKYIQARKINNIERTRPIKTERIESFNKKIQSLISAADSFFIASYYSQIDHRGADISHRGGSPEFIRIVDDRTLEFDDYAGNNLFMTLGNLHSHPVAGLLFIDFETGDTLQLACDTEIIEIANNKFSRKIRLTIKYGWFIQNALSIESQFIEYSPYLPD